MSRLPLRSPARRVYDASSVYVFLPDVTFSEHDYMVHINYFTVLLKGGVLFLALWVFVLSRRMRIDARKLDPVHRGTYLIAHSGVTAWLIANLTGDMHKLSLMLMVGFLIGVAGWMETQAMRTPSPPDARNAGSDETPP